MVLEFVMSGRHQDFLMAVHSACGHLHDLLSIDHPEATVDNIASAMTWPDAIRHHIQQDAEALLTWHEELARLLSRFPLAQAELESIDPLETSELHSLLTRTESTLASAIRGYPDVIRFQRESSERSPSFRGFVEGLARNLTEARSYISRMEAMVTRLSDKKSAQTIAGHVHSETGRSTPAYRGSRSLSQPAPALGPPRQDHTFSHLASSQSRGQPPSSSQEQKHQSGGGEGDVGAFSVEASSHFARQWQHNEIPAHDFQIGLHKIKNFVANGNTPSVPSHGEPHCYGGAPEHLNGVVIGGQERLIYYVDHDNGRPVIKLCCWISHAEHHDAFSRLRHQNMYRRIMSNDKSVKITRKEFQGFQALT